MSGSPWPVPREWTWRRFDDVARVASDLVDPAGFLEYPHIAPNHIESETGRLLPFTTIAEDGMTSPKHRFHTGQILYSKIRPYLAKVVMAEFEGLCSADMYPIEAGPSIDARFLRWWMLSREFTRRAAGEQARTVLPKINQRSLASLPVPVPPVQEQRRIVDILEDQLSHLDAATVELGLCRRRLLGLRIGTLSRLRRVLLDQRTPVFALGAITNSSLGKMLDAKKATGTPTPYLRNINVRWGEFQLGALEMVPLIDLERSKLALQPGDLLVCEGGEPGRSAVWPGSPSLVTYQKALHRLRVIDPATVDIHYVALMLEEFIRAGRAERMFTGTTIRHLPQEKLRVIEIPVPDLTTQREAVTSVGSTATGALKLRHGLDLGIARSQGLRRALLSAAFSGRLTGHLSDVDRIEELAGV